MARLDDQLERLAALPPDAVRENFCGILGGNSTTLPLSLMQRALAYRLQEIALGGLSARITRCLDALARDPEAPAPSPELQIKPGTRLLREWNGKRHSVLVTDDGVLFEDRRYASLSQVAREITGAHWSGPRFFGLRRRSNPQPYRGQARG